MLWSYWCYLVFYSFFGILVFTWRFWQSLYWNVLSFFLSIFVTWCFQEELYRIGLFSARQFYRLQACFQHVSIRVKDEALFIYVWILLEYPWCKIFFGKQGGVRVLTCQWSFPSSSSIRFGFYNKECCSNCHTSQYLGFNAGGRVMLDSRFFPLRVWSFDNIALW